MSCIQAVQTNILSINRIIRDELPDESVWFYEKIPIQTTPQPGGCLCVAYQRIRKFGIAIKEFCGKPVQGRAAMRVFGIVVCGNVCAQQTCRRAIAIAGAGIKKNQSKNRSCNDKNSRSWTTLPSHRRNIQRKSAVWIEKYHYRER